MSSVIRRRRDVIERSYAKQDCCHKQRSHRFAKKLNRKETTKKRAHDQQPMLAHTLSRIKPPAPPIPRSGLVQSHICSPISYVVLAHESTSFAGILGRAAPHKNRPSAPCSVARPPVSLCCDI